MVHVFTKEKQPMQLYVLVYPVIYQHVHSTVASTRKSVFQHDKRMKPNSKLRWCLLNTPCTITTRLTHIYIPLPVFTVRPFHASVLLPQKSITNSTSQYEPRASPYSLRFSSSELHSFHPYHHHLPILLRCTAGKKPW